MQRDGQDPAIMDLDPNKSVASQMKKEDDDGPPLNKDPTYEKYFKMLKMVRVLQHIFYELMIASDVLYFAFFSQRAYYLLFVCASFLYRRDFRLAP